MVEAGDDAEEEQRDYRIVDPVLAVAVRQHELHEAAAGHHDVEQQPTDKCETARRHQRAAAVPLPPRLDLGGRLLQRLGAHPETCDGPGYLRGTERVGVGIHGHPAVDDVERHPVDALAAGQRAPDERRLFRTVQSRYAEFLLFSDGSALVTATNDVTAPALRRAYRRGCPRGRSSPRGRRTRRSGWARAPSAPRRSRAARTSGDRSR